MKGFENDENNEYKLSEKCKVNDTIMKTNSRGTITYDGEYALLTYQRRLPHLKETIWKEITNPNKLSEWMNTKAIVDWRNGGTVDFVNIVSGFHTSGNILTWQPNKTLEHEWHIAPNPSLPQGESHSIIRWDLEQDGDSDTLLTLTHSYLSKLISLYVLPLVGMHTWTVLKLDLDNTELPDWIRGSQRSKNCIPHNEALKYCVACL